MTGWDQLDDLADDEPSGLWALLALAVPLGALVWAVILWTVLG